LQKNKKLKRSCIARIIERRMVSDSSGKKEKRIVIKSNLRLGTRKARIELTLANRDSMAFRMLIGRETLNQLKTIVDVSKAFLQGKPKRKEILKAYRDTKSVEFEII
jgi:ribosomal protein S6--L-glutamate ligase